MRWQVDFNQAPLLVIWEATRACALACQHCRASAQDLRHPDELTTDEGRRLISAVKAMGTPLFIFTGGDPLQREDLETLVRHAKNEGLRVGVIPAATPRLTRERVASLREAGMDQMAISLDGPDAASHDAFRMVQGTFDKAMEGARWAREMEIPLQVNTVFGQWNAHDFHRMAALVEGLGIVFWEVFFLVPTGRGTALKGCTKEQFEMLFEKIYQLTLRAPFIVKITEGQHYRRFLAEHGGAPGHGAAGHQGGRPGIGVSSQTVNSGRGFCFVDHVGMISPSGFLPIDCGNVRTSGLADVYRNHRVFRELRDASLLKGACASCPHREVCTGGSRARAFALTGDYLAEDPCCIRTALSYD